MSKDKEYLQFIMFGLGFTLCKAFGGIGFVNFFRSHKNMGEETEMEGKERPWALKIEVQSIHRVRRAIENQSAFRPMS